MKKSNFLKSIMFIMAMAFTFLTFNSCEDPVPACEKNNTGSMRVVNGSAYYMTVDVWDDYLGGFLGERGLNPYSSTTYSNVHAGSCEVWEVDQFSDWGYWDSSVPQCGTQEFTINIYKSASKKFEPARKTVE